MPADLAISLSVLGPDAAAMASRIVAPISTDCTPCRSRSGSSAAGLWTDLAMLDSCTAHVDPRVTNASRRSVHPVKPSEARDLVGRESPFAGDPSLRSG